MHEATKNCLTEDKSHNFQDLLAVNGGAVFSMYKRQYVSTETVLRNTPPRFDTVQVILSQQGEVLQYWSRQGADSTARVTQILWSVEDGNGHITVMVGKAI